MDSHGLKQKVSALHLFPMPEVIKIAQRSPRYQYKDWLSIHSGPMSLSLMDFSRALLLEFSWLDGSAA